MGKLLLFVGIIIAVVIVLGIWGFFLENRQTAHKMGLKGSKKKIAALEARDTRHVAALEEIRDIASSGEVVQGDPLWSLIASKADEALAEETTK